MRWSSVLIWLLAAALSGCGEEATAPAPLPGTAAAAQAPGLALIVHPYDTPSRIITRFQPLADYLSAQVGHPVRVQVAVSYGDQIRRIASGEAQLAYIGPTPYLRAQDHYLKGAERKLQLLAAEASEAGVGYRSVLVARADDPPATVADARGRTVAFGSPHSFSSHYVPRVMLARAGVELADLKDYAYLRRHERVALAVLHGDFDLGGLRKAIAEGYLARGLRIVEESPRLPPHVIAAAPDLDSELARRLREALLGAEREVLAEFQPFGEPVRFAPVEDGDFDLARAVVQAVEGACERERLPW